MQRVQHLSPSSLNRYYYKEMTVVAAAIVALLLVGLTLPGGAQRTFIEEGGVVETLSAAGYLVCIATLFRESTARFMADHFYFAAVPAAMCLRELDFHNALTTMSITKTRFYVSGDVPGLEKAVAIAVLALLAFCGVMLVRRHWRGFLTGLKRLDAVALALAAAGASAVAAKTLDGLARKLDGIGIDLGDDIALASTVIEEVLELGIPAFMAVAIFAYFARRNRLFEPPRRS